MKLFDVYNIYNIEPETGEGAYIFDTNKNKYLDFYGGHAVISIGHPHPYYIQKLKEQLDKIGFYSNSIINRLQDTLAEKLGIISGYTDYNLFLCNSGAEANENAIKLASFQTGKSRIIAFEKGFHGRTSAAVAVTDTPAIQAPVNKLHKVDFVRLNDTNALENQLKKGDVCAVIIEGIQGIGGIIEPTLGFLNEIQTLCIQYGAAFVADEIQSGYGRCGKFFAHNYSNVKPDLITIAKGMGNGFPVGGVLVSPEFQARKGLLGTTFGGNYLACAAAIAVIDVIQNENLVENAQNVGNYLIDSLKNINGIKEVRGKGLMIGLEFPFEISNLRKKLLFDYKVFTGVSGKNVIRLLPPLVINKEQADFFVNALKMALAE